MRSSLKALVALLALPWAGLAQTRPHAPLVLELPASTRALSLGGAFVLGSRDPDAVFYNPALLPDRGLGVATHRFGTSGVLLGASAATEWFGGTAGAGVLALGYGAPSSDPGAFPPADEALFSEGPVGATELVGAVAWGRRAGPLRVGAAGKAVDQRLGGRRTATGALDIGAALEAFRVTFGLAVQNLGPGLSLGDPSPSLPTRVSLGAAFEGRPLGPLDLGAAAAVTREAGGDLVPGLGAELAWWPVVGRTVAGRIGARRVPEGGADAVTYGAAYLGDRLTLEYAYQGYDGGRGAHRATVRWR